MKIHKDYKVEACASTDKDRDAIRYVNIEDNGGSARAVATDGRSAAIVPVVLDDGDVCGEVTPESIKAARKKTLGDRAAQLFLRDDFVLCEDTTEYPRSFESTTDPQGDLFRRKVETTFPNVDSVVPSKGKSMTVALDVKLLKQVCDAIGATKNGCTLEVKLNEENESTTDAIVVRPCDAALRDDGAFGIVMPLRVK